MNMHVLIVNFKLKGIDDAQYARLCDEVAPAFAAVPGLASKLWIRNADTGTYGGVYIFESLDAYRRYEASDLFRTVAAHPNLTSMTATDFEILDAPTRVTSRALISAVS
jgi:hypothetical protein